MVVPRSLNATSTTSAPWTLRLPLISKAGHDPSRLQAVFGRQAQVVREDGESPAELPFCGRVRGDRGRGGIASRGGRDRDRPRFEVPDVLALAVLFHDKVVLPESLDGLSARVHDHRVDGDEAQPPTGTPVAAALEPAHTLSPAAPPRRRRSRRH